MPSKKPPGPKDGPPVGETVGPVGRDAGSLGTSVGSPGGNDSYGVSTGVGTSAWNAAPTVALTQGGDGLSRSGSHMLQGEPLDVGAVVGAGVLERIDGFGVGVRRSGPNAGDGLLIK